MNFNIYLSCTFHTVGSAAGEQKFNSLCILSLNIINEKVSYKYNFLIKIIININFYQKQLKEIKNESQANDNKPSKQCLKFEKSYHENLYLILRPLA